MKCPNCKSEKVEEEINSGLYVCDSGCEWVSYLFECYNPKCGISYENGHFGCFDNDEEKQEWLEEFREEILKDD